MKWKWTNDRRGERNLSNCVKKPEKIQDFNGVWTHDLAIPVWCSTNWVMKPLTLGAGQLWVHMFPWKKWLLTVYEIYHIWTAEMKWKWRNGRCSECNLCNCVKKPGKKNIQDFNGVWTRDLAILVRCSTNWALTPLTLGAGQDTRYAGDTWDLGTHLPGSQSLWEFLRSQYWDCHHSMLSWMICLAQLQCKHTILSTYADDTQIL